MEGHCEYAYAAQMSEMRRLAVVEAAPPAVSPPEPKQGSSTASRAISNRRPAEAA